MKFKFLFAMLVGAALAANANGYKDGIEYYKADQFENAKEILEKNLNNAGTDKALSYYYLGQIDLRNGDKAAAKANFDKGIAADAANPYNYVGLGAINLLNGDKKAAEENFKKATSFDKKNFEVQAYIARAYYNADPIKYAPEIEKMIEKIKKDKVGKNEPAVYILEGDMEMDKNNPGAAASKYETAIYYEGDNPEGYVKYAEAYFHVNPDFAVKKLEELHAKNPTSALAQRELAEKYFSNSQWLKASDMYGQYIQNPNHFPQDKERYSFLLYYGERYPESLQIANEILAQNPNSFLSARLKLLNLEKLERYEEAAAAGDAFFKLNGYFTGNDYITLANVLGQLERNEEAVALMEKAFANDPSNEGIVNKLAAAYQAVNRNGEAADVFAAFVDNKEGANANDFALVSGKYLTAVTTTEDPEAKADLAAKGIVYVDKALEQAPQNVTLNFRKAQLLFAGNDNKPNEATAEVLLGLLDILDQNPDNKTTNANTYKMANQILGVYYNSIGDKENAIKYFEGFLEFDPNNEGIATLVEKLKESKK